MGLVGGLTLCGVFHKVATKPEIIADIRRVLRKKNLHLRLVKGLPEYNWSGKSRTLVVCSGEAAHDILHEVAHVLVAEPWHLKHPEYALGGSSLALGSCAAVEVFAQRYEELASLLGLYWLRSYDETQAADLFQEHNWNVRDWEYPLSVLRLLRRHRILVWRNRRLVPRLL